MGGPLGSFVCALLMITGSCGDAGQGVGSIVDGLSDAGDAQGDLGKARIGSAETPVGIAKTFAGIAGNHIGIRKPLLHTRETFCGIEKRLTGFGKSPCDIRRRLPGICEASSGGARHCTRWTKAFAILARAKPNHGRRPQISQRGQPNPINRHLVWFRLIPSFTNNRTDSGTACLG